MKENKDQMDNQEEQAFFEKELDQDALDGISGYICVSWTRLSLLQLLGEVSGKRDEV